MAPRFVLIPVLALAIAGCGASGGGADEAQSTELPGDSSSRGAQLVASEGCLGCHRLGSEGAGGPGPELTEIGGRLSAGEIEDVLVNPRPPMPSYSNLPDGDRQAIAEYLAGLK